MSTSLSDDLSDILDRMFVSHDISVGKYEGIKRVAQYIRDREGEDTADVFEQIMGMILEEE